MRLFVRILAGVAIGLVVLLGIAAVVIATIDARTLIAPLEAQIEQATGRDIALGGEARIGVSLTPTLELSDVTVSNAPWGSEKTMIRAKRLEAQVALLPLLSKRVEIVRFTLIEPSILLETDARGRGNWTLREPAKDAPPSDPVADAAGAFGLGEFAVENGQLRWRDGRSGEVTAVRIERLYLRARDPGKPVVAEFRGRIADLPIALEGHFGPLAALQAKQWPWPVSIKGDIGNRKVEIEAKLREVPDGVQASDLVYATGSTRLRGIIVYAARSPRPHVRFDLAGETVNAAELAIAGGAAAATAGATTPPARQDKPDGRVFKATPVPLSGLRAVDADGTLAIDKLVLADGKTFNAVRVKLHLADGKLDVSDIRANALGGSASARLLVDARNERNPSLALRADLRGLDLASLMALAGVSRDVRGGETNVDIDVNARGNSPREWASSASGLITVKVGNAQWASSTSGLPAELGRLVVTLNPLAEKGGTTELTCAALRLPLNGGVARIDRSLAFETTLVGVAASGTIDLRNETLDLAVHPRVKQRNVGDLAKIASAIRVQGPLDAPHVALDPAGSIAAAVDIAALARNGRAALQGLLAPGAAPSGPGECAVALGAARAPAAAPSPGRAAGQPARPAGKDPVEEINRALGKLLRR